MTGCSFGVEGIREVFVKGVGEAVGAFATAYLRNGQPTRDGHYGSQS